MLSSLNQRQQLFVYHYLKGLSITRAAIEAGYSSKPECAAVIGSRLLKNVKVRNAIEYLNEQSGITPSSVVSKLASVFHNKNTRPSDVIKLSKLFFKIKGLDLTKSETRRPTRNRKASIGSISYSLDNLVKPNGDTYNKEAIVEDSSFKEAEQVEHDPVPSDRSHRDSSPGELSRDNNHLKIERAVPKSFPKAIPKSAEMRKPAPAYSLFGFKGDDESDSTSQSGNKVFYPA